MLVGKDYVRNSTGEVERVRRATSGTNVNTITRRDTSHVELVTDIATGLTGNGTSQNGIQEQYDGINALEFDVSALDDTEDDKGNDSHPVSLFLGVIK